MIKVFCAPDSPGNMFTARAAASCYRFYYSPSSRCLPTSANSAGLKGCSRGRVQLLGVFLLFFVFSPEHCSGILVSVVFVLSLRSFCSFPLPYTGVRSMVFRRADLLVTTLPSHFFVTFSYLLSLCAYMAAERRCLVATSSMYLHCVGSVTNAPVITTCAVQRRRGDWFQIHYLPLASWD